VSRWLLLAASAAVFAGCGVMPGLSFVEFSVTPEPVPTPHQVEVPRGVWPAVAVEDPNLPVEIYVKGYGRTWALFGFLVPFFPVVDHAPPFELELRFPGVTGERPLVASQVRVETEGRSYSPSQLLIYGIPLGPTPNGVQLDAPISVSAGTGIRLTFEQLGPPREPFAITVDGVARVEFVPQRHTTWHLSPFF